jgi:D-hydroxyproline dehydrogenase subunit alpha
MACKSQPMHRSTTAEIVIIGAGPAGIAAAIAAAETGKTPLVVDDNYSPGGQIWRSGVKHPPAKAMRLLKRLANTRTTIISGARVTHQPEPGRLIAETRDGLAEIEYGKLILATGARELFLPFPGWTLPNVLGAGGLQALVKSGLPMSGKKVVVAGSGPLLLAVAVYLRQCGASVLAIAEQASRSSILSFGLELARAPSKIAQACRLQARLIGVPYLTGCWPVAALGESSLSSLLLRRANRTGEVDCDYLACGFHLVPNVELPLLLGCETEGQNVLVNDYQETSLKGVYCAGETTGIGGVELALSEGRIAGLAASSAPHDAEKLFPSRARHRRFAAGLNRAFTLRPELKALAESSTIVCRCEDVELERLRSHSCWRSAKLHTRCGMGPCQGRICGPAVGFILGWKAESVRPPIFPARLETLADSLH